MSLNKNVPRDLTQKTIWGIYPVFNKEWVAGGMKGGWNAQTSLKGLF